MRLQLIQIIIFRQVSSKMFRSAKRVQIDKHSISFQMTGIADLQMQRVREHISDFGTHFVRSICQIDTVAQ